MRRRAGATAAVLGTVAAALGVGAAWATAPAANEPPLVATPAATCGAGSSPETDLQGRVPGADFASGRVAEGYTCNAELVGAFADPEARGTVGGFKVHRYVDASGHECAYYDSTLVFPTNLFDAIYGVVVLDMTDPAHPVKTDQLVTPAMLSPHESLVLSPERGLLAAVQGNPAVGPGVIDVYDISADCRHPVLLSSAPVGVFGHESGLSPDGLTFYSASPFTATIVAVDLSDPTVPTPLWIGRYGSHGLSVSADGNRVYVASITYGGLPGEPTQSGLRILDTSEIQARTPNPQVREVGRLTWSSVSVPQNAIPVTIGGHPYLVEVDEFGAGSAVGAARIIDISDETNPFVVSNLRLAVHQPENFAAIEDDPGAFPYIGYSAHYCAVPTRVDPTIVACSMVGSGLRVFDIRDPANPREVAYFNRPRVTGSLMGGSLAMSAPAFVPERHEVWYTDGASGFYAVRLTNGAWPEAAPVVAPDGAPPAEELAAPAEVAATASAPARALPATGWPVPVAAAAGFLLVALGLRHLLVVR